MSMFANNPKSSNSNRIRDIYNPNREHSSDNDDMISVSELNKKQRQEIAQLREKLTTAQIRVATLEERAIHNDTRNEDKLLRSEERYRCQIQAQDMQIQELKRLHRNILSVGVVLVLFALSRYRYIYSVKKWDQISNIV
ncbi:hypothetical protein BELL_0277g00080 [Botrytis elliptica]|uniref:Uncharacterized protein n=1 Tax=Botrytis elliptica TaxID=278938 RepID=A0A4Z1JLI6_9HELO|nr:hypothetical protein BELL_0277g00080 [Botrytis elliptica]